MQVKSGCFNHTRIQGVLVGLEQLDAERRARDAAKRRAGVRRGRGSSPSSFRAIGDCLCRVQGPRAFSNDFGNPRGGGRRRHQGNDILAPRGTPIVAPVSGTVRRHDNRLGGISFYLTGTASPLRRPPLLAPVHLDGVEGLVPLVLSGYQ